MVQEGCGTGWQDIKARFVVQGGGTGCRTSRLPICGAERVAEKDGKASVLLICGARGVAERDGGYESY